MKILDGLIKAIRSAAVFNPDVQVAPACILWPDRDRQWEAVIPRLQNEMPELLVLGATLCDCPKSRRYTLFGGHHANFIPAGRQPAGFACCRKLPGKP